MPDPDPPKSLRDRAIDAAFNQGIGAVLLAMILLQFPSLLARIQKGYDEHAEKLDNTVKMLINQSEKDRQFYVDIIQRKLDTAEASAEAREEIREAAPSP